MTKLLIALLLSLLASCALTGTATPQTFNQKLAYAYGLHTAVLQATTTAVTAGTLSSANATKVLAKADDAKAVLDAANSAYAAGDAAGANSKLAIATAALSAIQAYLNSHPTKPIAWLPILTYEVA
jgi:hypothetical protein